MAVSEQELTAHVARRLGMGANAGLVAKAATPQGLITAMLSAGKAEEFDDVFAVPKTYDDIEDKVPGHELVWWWIERMSQGATPLRERMTWFWHDHFAASFEKVDNTYLMWDQHRTIRRDALGNFRDLLIAVSTGGAMLRYLDGVDNSAEAINENFGRELMELHTMGVGNYTQADVVAVARACTGWMINEPDWDTEDFLDEVEPWAGYLNPEYHDSGPKTVLGVTGRHGMIDVIDIILSQPVTGRFLATKLYRELVGLQPDDATATRLGRDFARSYEIAPLVEAIVSEPGFLSESAVRAKVRTPVEKLVTLFQSFEIDEDFDAEWMFWVLEGQGYVPFNPPNPAGYPKGRRLLSPGNLIGSFELLQFLAEPPPMTVEELFARFGVHDLDRATRSLLQKQTRHGIATALAFGSPEFALT